MRGEAAALEEVAADDEREELLVPLRGCPPDVLGEGRREEADERVGLVVVARRGERPHGEAAVREGVRVAEGGELVALRQRARREKTPPPPPAGPVTMPPSPSPSDDDREAARRARWRGRER